MYVTAAWKAEWLIEGSAETSAKGSRMYPVCAIPEYASNRTTCLCWRATRFPRVIVTSDRATNRGTQNAYSWTKATNINWSRPANPAADDATPRNAATGTGDPSYVSGAQNWNGTALILKANPTTTKRIAALARISFAPDSSSSPALTAASWRCPVSP